MREMTPEMAAANSPHNHVARIATPMLVIHGDADQVLPLDNRVLWALVNPKPDHRRPREQFRYFQGGAQVGVGQESLDRLDPRQLGPERVGVAGLEEVPVGHRAGAREGASVGPAGEQDARGGGPASRRSAGTPR